MTLDLEWMAWTVPTAAFFAAIAACLMCLTVMQVVSPSIPRRGLLPMVTTRGDRFFIALLVAAFLQIGWLVMTDPESGLWVPLIAAITAGLAILRWG